MEDQRRAMASPEEVVNPPRERGSREKRFTVMIMRSLGGVRSFKISPVLIVWSMLFFIVFAVVSIFAINGYLNLRRLMVEQKRQLVKMAEKSNDDLRAIQKAEQRIALLRGYIQDLEKPRKKKRGSATQKKTETPPEVRRRPAPKAKPAPVIAPPPEEKKKPEPSTSQPTPQESPVQAEKSAVALVDVRDLVMRKEDSRLTVDFKLFNLGSEENAAGGYVHTIAKIEESDPPQKLSYPIGKLKEGRPVNYRRGQPFLIQRFRPMKAKFDLTNTSHPPSSIHFIVYDQSGKLLLEKAFEVKDDL